MKRFSFCALLALITYTVPALPMLPLVARSTAHQATHLTRPATPFTRPFIKRSFSYNTPKKGFFYDSFDENKVSDIIIAGSTLGAAGAGTYTVIDALSDKKKYSEMETFPINVIFGGIAGYFVGVSMVPVMFMAHKIGRAGTTAWAGGTLLAAYYKISKKSEQPSDTEEE